MLKTIFAKFLSGQPRTVRAKKNIAASVFIKGGNIIINLLMVPILIDFLNPEKYGIWLTITSFVGWFVFLDIGMGHGLRNRFAEALAKKNYLLAKSYVTTAYLTLFAISLTIVVVAYPLTHMVNWSIVFNSSAEFEKELKYTMSIVLSVFAMRLTFSLINSILLGDQQNALSSFLNFIGQSVALILIYIFRGTSQNALILMSLIYSFTPVFILILATVVLFRRKYKLVRPSYKAFNFSHIKDILNLGSKFFIIEISFVVLYTTDNFIISHLFSPAEVTPYNISFRYFSILTMLFSIINTPFWSAYTEAYVNQDYNWIIKIQKILLKIWLGIVLLSIVLLLTSPIVYRFWIGDSVKIPFLLSFVMMLNAIIATFRNIFVYFLNGIGKIKLQTYSAIIGASLHIPLAIFFARSLNIGVSGVMIATITTGTVGALLVYIQTKKIILGTARGIWSK